jgi:hypothetical protein
MIILVHVSRELWGLERRDQTSVQQYLVLEKKREKGGIKHHSSLGLLPAERKLHVSVYEAASCGAYRFDLPVLVHTAVALTSM